MKRLMFVLIMFSVIVSCRGQGQTIRGNISVTGDINVDDINEYTSGAGLTIDGVGLKDNDVNLTNGSFNLITPGEGLQFGDFDTKLYESADDYLQMWVGGSVKLIMTPTEFTHYVDQLPNATLTYDLGSSTKYWAEFYVGGPMYVGNGSTQISLVGSDLTFLDGVAGAKKLSDLVVPYGTQSQLPRTNSGGTSFDYGSDFTYDGTTLVVDEYVKTNFIQEFTASAGVDIEDVVLRNNSGYPEVYLDNSQNNWSLAATTDLRVSSGTLERNNALYSNTASQSAWYKHLRRGGTPSSPAAAPTDAVIQTVYGSVYGSVETEAYTLKYFVDGAISTNTFDAGITWSLRDGTTNPTQMKLSPDYLTVYTNINLNTVNSSKLTFGDYDTYLIEPSDDVIDFYTAGGLRFRIAGSGGSNLTANDLLPNATNIDLGDIGYEVNTYASVAANKLYLGNINTYIDTSGNNIRFTDPTTGSKTLAELVGGGPSYDTAAITDLARLLEDTVLLWCWDITDSALFKTSFQVCAFYHEGPDTLYVTQGRVGVRTSDVGANFYYNVQYAPHRDDSPTTLYTSAVQVTGTELDEGGEVDTPNNPSIPPGYWVWLTIDSYTTRPVWGASFNFRGYEY